MVPRSALDRFPLSVGGTIRHDGALPPQEGAVRQRAPARGHVLGTDPEGATVLFQFSTTSSWSAGAGSSAASRAASLPTARSSRTGTSFVSSSPCRRAHVSSSRAAASQTSATYSFRSQGQRPRPPSPSSTWTRSMRSPHAPRRESTRPSRAPRVDRWRLSFARATVRSESQ